jgi:uncharacterized protein
MSAMTKTLLPVLCFVLSALLWPVSAGAQGAPEPPPRVPVVITQGDALLRRAPDQAWVELAVETRARAPKEATSRNAQIMSAVHERLRALGIPAEAIQTRGYQLTPEFDYIDGRQVPRGYAARNRIEVRVDQIDRAGEVIDAGIGAGATGAGGIRFDLKDRAAAEREALRLAVADARARAEAAAAGGGLSIGRIVRIEEGGRAAPPPIPMMARMAAAEADVQTPVAPGEIEIRVSVTLTAELK